MSPIRNLLGQSLCAWLCLNTLLVGAPAVKITPLNVPDQGRAGFHRLLPKDTGLMPSGKYRAIIGEIVRDTSNSGLAAGDINGDGLPDIFVCGMEKPNALYLNQGNWKFKNITEQAGVTCRGWRLSGALFSDVDGDRDLDLILTSLRDTRNFLFLNDGNGRFTESLNIGWMYNHRAGSAGSSMADVDGDGDLDLYVTSFLKHTPGEVLGPKELERIYQLGVAAKFAGRPMPDEWLKIYSFRKVPTTGQVVIDVCNMQDHLYLNDGRGNFRAVTDNDHRFRDVQGRPIAMPKDPSHEAAFRDVDGDGDPDLYVCSDFDWADRFWRNDGRGNFTLIEPIALRRTSQFSMGIDFTDLNRDGHLDFITADMLSRSHKRRKTQMGMMQATDAAIGLIHNRPQIMQNTLHLNRGDGTWTEIAQFAGVKASEWSWGLAFTDVDLDGYEDLIVATGMIRDFMDADATAEISNAIQGASTINTLLKSTVYPKLPTQNIIYRNRGNLTFEYKSDPWGFAKKIQDEDKVKYEKYKAVSGGLAQADFDGDGDLDLIFNNIEPLEIYRNESNAPRVAVRLIGRPGNVQAIGAKVRLLGGPGKANGLAPMEQEIHSGGGYASGSDPLAVFGTGTITEGLKLEIIWRDRGTFTRRVISNVKPNHLYEISQGEDTPHPIPATAPVKTLFIKDFEKLDIQMPDGPMRVGHSETPFDDFAYQPLLPNRLSQLGPGVAWTDVNQDGLDDLIIAAGRGRPMLIYHGQPGGRFKIARGPVADLDQTGVIGWTPKPGAAPTLLTGISNFEAPGKAFNRAPLRGLNPAKDFSIQFSLPSQRSTTGPMALADVDGDGDLDLFLGGRMVPERYPEPADSQLFINQNGELKRDNSNAGALKQLGLVSGAVFGDLDGDGDPDLVLALEWGPVKILRNQNGQFTDATKAFGLDAHKGWWNSVTLGDFDADGRLDIVAGNWGRNSKYEQSYSITEPLRMAYGDFDNNGVIDIVENHYDKETGKWVPERGRSCSMNAMPFIGQRNQSFDQFGSGSLEKVYGECLKDGKALEANTLSHTLFLNRGNTFTPRALPAEAQFAPVFGMNVADFDGDGYEDLFVAQNFFASQRETPRSDGGRGLLLRGDGKGGFTSVPGQKSGLKIYGEQRGSAVADYNHDGRPDLVVSQNGAATHLYQNAHGHPGLRVRLNAGPANPTGVGAIARLIFADDKKGPAKIVTAGSGYWSQDSAVLILARPSSAAAPAEIEVQWPHGKTTTSKIPAGAAEIEITSKGELKKVK